MWKCIYRDVDCIGVVDFLYFAESYEAFTFGSYFFRVYHGGLTVRVTLDFVDSFIIFFLNSICFFHFHRADLKVIVSVLPGVAVFPLSSVCVGLAVSGGDPALANIDRRLQVMIFLMATKFCHSNSSRYRHTTTTATFFPSSVVCTSDAVIEAAGEVRHGWRVCTVPPHLALPCLTWAR